MEHNSLPWARSLSMTNPGSQREASENTATPLDGTDQSHSDQLEKQAMQQAVMADITRRQAELQRMVAAQSVAQREIAELLSSVVPANRSGPVVNTQLASGLLGGNFDAKPAYNDLNLVAPNISSSLASNLHSHLLSSADLSGLQSRRDCEHSMPSGTPRPPQYAQSIPSAFPAWSSCSYQLGTTSGTADSQQQPHFLHATFPAGASSTSWPSSLHGSVPSGAAQPPPRVPTMVSAFYAFAQPGLHANKTLPQPDTANLHAATSALLLRNMGQQLAGSAPHATSGGDGGSGQHSAGLGGALSAASMLSVQNTFRPPPHRGGLPGVPEGACLDQGAHKPPPLAGAGAAASGGSPTAEGGEGRSTEGGKGGAGTVGSGGREKGVKGRGHCDHGRRRSDCKECKGAGICEHNKRRSLCKECGGSCICEHGRIRYQCKLCGGSQICEHKRRRSHCKDCWGTAICEHRRQRHQCKQCKGQGESEEASGGEMGRSDGEGGERMLAPGSKGSAAARSRSAAPSSS